MGNIHRLASHIATTTSHHGYIVNTQNQNE